MGNGMEVARKHQIHPMTLHRWGKALQQGAQSFLRGKRPQKDGRIKELKKENRKLKEALACQTQELMLIKKRMNLV
jgi:transposase-like protein